MLTSFPAELKKHGLQADVRTVLNLYTLMSGGLIRNLGGLYSCGERVVVKDPRQMGPYTVAFFSYFLDIQIGPGQSLDDAVMRSDVFARWRREHAAGRVPSRQLVDDFLDDVLNRIPDFQGLETSLSQQLGHPPEISVPFAEQDATADEIEADHSGEDMDDLLRRMQEIAKEQNESHTGGKKFIGTGGTSPYGHDGRSSAGVRVAGRSAHLSARMVLNDPRYFPLDMNAILSDNNVDAALAVLKGVEEHSSRPVLDIDETVRKGAKRAGIILPELKGEEEDRLNVMLFIDNGGFSMDPHIPVVRSLFQKMKTRFSHDLRIFYFHNIIDPVVYADEARNKYPVTLDSLLREGKHHRVFIVGDASMAPYELHGTWMGTSGFGCLSQMAAAFPRLVWLNPVREGAWGRTETIENIRSIIKMFPLTPRGIEKAVIHLNLVADKNTDERLRAAG